MIEYDSYRKLSRQFAQMHLSLNDYNLDKFNSDYEKAIEAYQECQTNSVSVLVEEAWEETTDLYYNIDRYYADRLSVFRQKMLSYFHQGKHDIAKSYHDKAEMLFLRHDFSNYDQADINRVMNSIYSEYAGMIEDLSFQKENGLQTGGTPVIQLYSGRALSNVSQEKFEAVRSAMGKEEEYNNKVVSIQSVLEVPNDLEDYHDPLLEKVYEEHLIQRVS